MRIPLPLLLALSLAPVAVGELKVTVRDDGGFTVADGDVVFVTDGRTQNALRAKAEGNGIAFEDSGVASALVAWGDGAFACRLDPGQDRDLVQLACGRASSLLADSLFDPQRDAGITFEGEAVRLTPVANGWRLDAAKLDRITLVRDVYSWSRGVKHYRPLDRSKLPRPPAGWCSWQARYQGVTEKDVLDNARWLARHLGQFGCEYVRIDDGWQGRGQGGGDNRDWFAPSRKFTSTKRLADEIRKLGLKPGLWLCPFGQSNEAILKDNPEVFVCKGDGSAIDGRWVGKYIVDPTGEAGQEYLRLLAEMVTREWGYEMLKLDGLAPLPRLYDSNMRLLTRSTLGGDDVLRGGLNTIKSAVGPECLLTCDVTQDAVGVCPCIRSGQDVGASWAGLQAAVNATARRLFLNTIVCYTDPDAICVGPPLTLEQAQAWASLYGLTGQMTFASDRMPDLPGERVQLLRRILPVADIRPMALYAHSEPPRIFDLKVARDWGNWEVVGLFNWSATQAISLAIGPRRLGLEPGRYVYFDIWRQALADITDNDVSAYLPPASCRVLLVRKFEDHPQLLGSSRHVTQGADDLFDVRWDAPSTTISGISHVVGRQPYELCFTLPPGWSATGRGVRSRGFLAIGTILRDKSDWVRWQVEFTQTGIEPPPLAAPASAELATKGFSATIRWASVEGAFGYIVYRNGEMLAKTAATSLTDPLSKPKTEYGYSVAAYGWGGRESDRTPAGQFTTPKILDKWLDELTPVSVTQGWGKLETNKSVESNTLTINGRTFPRGFGSHSNAEIVYDVGGIYARFVAEVGVDDETNGGGSVAFQVFVDDQCLFDSGVMKGKQSAKRVDVSVAGKMRLKLVVTDGGDGLGSDHADWCDAKLIGSE